MGSAQGQASLGNAMRPEADGKWQAMRETLADEDEQDGLKVRKLGNWGQ